MKIEGEVTNSVLFTGAKVGAGAKVIDSVLMPGVVVEEGAVVTRALVADNITIGKGAVVGSGSVVVRDVPTMSVVSGNPATEFKKRRCVHSDLVVESLLGGDYRIYKSIKSHEL